MDGSERKSSTVAQFDAKTQAAKTQELQLHTPSVDPALRGPVSGGAFSPGTIEPASVSPGPVEPAGPSGPTGSDPDRHQPPREPRRQLPRTLVAALVVGVLVICCAVALNITTGALANLNPFKNGVVQNQTIDRSGPAVLKAISDLGDFRAASGYYELVVDVEKDVKPVPSFLAGERKLFIAAGTVEVGVNLRGLGAGAIVINDDRTSATITLPPPTLSPPNLDTERSYIYSQQRGLMDRLKDALGDNTDGQKELYALASKRLAEAASQSDDLRTRAETNTRSMLEGLLRSLGFTDITVNFTGTPTPEQ
jgi:hypothetical protein